VRSEGDKEIRSSDRRGEVFWVQRERTQEVGVSKHEEEKAGGSGTTVRSVEEGEET